MIFLVKNINVRVTHTQELTQNYGELRFICLSKDEQKVTPMRLNLLITWDSYHEFSMSRTTFDP